MKSCHFWRFLHCQRPPRLGLLVAADAPVHPGRKEREVGRGTGGGGRVCVTKTQKRQRCGCKNNKKTTTIKMQDSSPGKKLWGRKKNARRNSNPSRRWCFGKGSAPSYCSPSRGHCLDTGKKHIQWGKQTLPDPKKAQQKTTHVGSRVGGLWRAGWEWHHTTENGGSKMQNKKQTTNKQKRTPKY